MNKDIDVALKKISKEPTYSSYLACGNVLDKIMPERSDMTVLKVAILRNFILDPLIPVIKGEIASAGFYPVIYLGYYDTIAQDTLSSQSALYNFSPDVVIMAQWLETLAPVLINRFPSLSAGQVDNEIERVLGMVVAYLTALRRQSSKPIIINNFMLPEYPALGIMDAQSENYQIHSILRLNLELLRRLRNFQDIYLVDYMSLIARFGSEQVVDRRYWHIGRAPLGRSALVPLGQAYGKIFRALYGKNCKCLVLDCDNVLWGGVIGEDGMEGIKIGADYPGSCYQALQQEILNLHDRGVILALCSKNNESDVLDVLRNHPGMILKENHFAIYKINWESKADNLKKIAHDLNIGLDSLVFVDDNQFECDLVREQLPQVSVLQLSCEPHCFREALRGRDYFDTLVLSDEDLKRNDMYRDQVKRKQLCESSVSLEDYLAKLDMVAEIGLADTKVIPRIAQLTQKTNQFNLTTHRYTEGDILAFSKDSNSDVFYLRLRDKVSDMGLIGVAIVKHDNEGAFLDTFLMSCRALGRGVEEVFLVYILNSAKSRGCKRILGEYLSTNKNRQVADFYGRQGFKLVDQDSQSSRWELVLHNQAFLGPKWIKVNV